MSDPKESPTERWDPMENCYCGGEIYPHPRGAGQYCRDPLERSDLPVGQQSKDLSEVEQLRHEVKKWRYLERSAKRYALEAEKEAEGALAVAAERGAELARVRADMARYRVAEFDAENPDVLVARVRAQLAEDLARLRAEIEHFRDEWTIEGDSTWLWLTRILDGEQGCVMHAVAPAESVVAALPDVVGTPDADCPNSRRYGAPARVEHCGPGCHEAHTYLPPCELSPAGLPEE